MRADNPVVRSASGSAKVSSNSSKAPIGDDGFNDARIEILEAAVGQVEDGQIGETEDFCNILHLAKANSPHLGDGEPEAMALLGCPAAGPNDSSSGCGKT